MAVTRNFNFSCRHFLSSFLSLPSWELAKYLLFWASQDFNSAYQTTNIPRHSIFQNQEKVCKTQNCFQTLQAIRETQGADHRSVQESEQSWGKPHQIPTDLQDQILKCGEMLWRFVNFIWCKLSLQINVKHFIYRKDVDTGSYIIAVRKYLLIAPKIWVPVTFWGYWKLIRCGPFGKICLSS